MADPQIFPPGWEQPAITDFIVAGVNEQHDAVIGFLPDDPTYGLEHAVHAGKSVSIFKTCRVFLLEIVPDQVPFDTQLRQPHADDDGTDQPLADQVNAFAEDATQHGEAHQRFTMLN